MAEENSEQLKEETLQKIHLLVTQNPVVLFMKGTPQFPTCGFSSRAAQALAQTGEKFAFVNVQAAPDIYEYLPAYQDWPTFPQLYIDGELVGGADITLELFESGELKTMMKAANEKYAQKQES